MRFIAAFLGITAFILFGLTLLVFSILNSDFNFLEDYVSKLGAKGQPFALWWNLIGFLSVGFVLAAFGMAYGCVVQDRLVGLSLTLFGVGFGATALPIDLGDTASPVSKAHIVAICLALAAWLLGLARMGYLPSLGRSARYTANIAASLLVLPILGQVMQLWSMPVTHRLVFAVVFGWVALSSFILLWDDVTRRRSDERSDTPIKPSQAV